MLCSTLVIASIDLCTALNFLWFGGSHFQFPSSKDVMEDENLNKRKHEPTLVRNIGIRFWDRKWEVNILYN